MKPLKNESLNSFENFAKLNKTLTNLPSKLDESQQNLKMTKNNTILTKVQYPKSAQSIFEMDKLNKTLSKLRDKCSAIIAQKYLTGFLENKGANTLEEYLAKLE